MNKFFKYPWVILAVYAVITVFFLIQLPKIQLDNNNFHFVPKNDKALLTSEQINNEFGTSTFIMVGLEQKHGTIFEKDFLLKVKDYVDKISQIPNVGTVDSIVSADYLDSDGDAIVASPMVSKDFSGTDEEIAGLKDKLVSWDIYRRSLISDDFTSTEIVVPFNIEDTKLSDSAIIADQLKVRDIAHEMFNPDTTNVYVTGIPIIAATINEAIYADMKLLIPLVILVVLFIIWLPLKRLSFVAVSLVSVIVAGIWAIGSMALFDIKLSLISTMIPVILTAIGSSYGLHLIIHYFSEAPDNFETMTPEEHKEFIIRTVRVLTAPITLAALTTTASFISFCFTPVIPIFNFGLFSSIGVIISFAASLTLVPAILIIRGPASLKKFKRQVTKQSALSFSANEKIAGVFTRIARHSYIVLVVIIAIVLVSAYGASKVVNDNIFIEYFRPYTGISQSDKFMREKFGGSKVINIVTEADTSADALSVDNLVALDGLKTYLTERVPNTGSVLGFTDMVKRINQVFNADESPEGISPASESRPAPQVTAGAGNDSFGFGFGFGDSESGGTAAGASASKPEKKAKKLDTLLTTTEFASFLNKALDRARSRELTADELISEIEALVNYNGMAYYEVPSDPAKYGKKTKEELSGLISNYLVLLSGDISSFANDPLEPTKLRTMVQLRTVGNIDTSNVIKDINSYINDKFPKNINVVIGGSALVENSLNDLVVRSLWTSMLIALVSLFLIVTICNKSVIAGLICVIPLGVIILVNFGFMGLMGFKLNIATALISSLSMGIGIDYAIHYLEAYKREYRATGGKGDFFKRSYLNAGLAIIVDALSVGVGFAVLLFSKFVLLGEFGLLVAFSMITSALMGLILVPALLLLIKPKFIEGKRDNGRKRS